MFTMTDHYGWTTDGQRRVRAFDSHDATVLFAVDPARPPLLATDAGFKLGTWRTLEDHQIPAELWEPLSDLLPLYRVATPTLWEACATAVIRQVVRASHAKALYRGLCEAAGTAVAENGTSAWTFPTPAAVLDLSDDELAKLGLTFKAAPLRTLATAYQQSGPAWEQLDAAEAYEALLALPRIGPWTASVAVWDRHNDPAFYPYDDLAVQTWAKKTAPGLDWPVNRNDFGSFWSNLAGPHRALLTLLVLAKGNHHASPI